jgi:hypothetical protein
MFALSIAGKDVMITRYTAVAAPFMLAAIAVAVVTAPRPLGIAFLAVALVPAVAVTAKSHRATGFYVNARGAIDYVAHHRAPRDVVVTPGQADPDTQLAYYGTQRLRPPPAYLPFANAAGIRNAVAQRRRLWLIAVGDRRLVKAARANLAPIGYRASKVRFLPADVPLVVILAAPAPR